ncbi:MAG TPA: hypothetical protein VFV86_11480 [Nitrososphaeraceae archaeon]|nr:hypothetical protein [Nitrososphaeraceae archaeon]
MKSYPSITKEVRQDIYIYAFDKLDGSNIRAEWNYKKGFYKFGTRNQLTDEKTMPFGRAIPLLKEKYEADLTAVFAEQHWRDSLCFFEYHGPSSFAGNHNFEEKMDITLIDVNPFKEGILPPTEFIKYFGHLDIAKVLYEGHVNVELFDKVKNSALNGMTFEGCVCKGIDNGKLVMFKIKSKAWYDKLKHYCKDDDALFKKLE